MKKHINGYFNYLTWLLWIISYSALGVITDQISSKYSDNYNNTGVIIYKDYSYNSDVEFSIIKTYGYIENNVLASLIQNQKINSLTDISYKDVNMLFTLLPRRYENNRDPSKNIANDLIFCFNSYLDYYYRGFTVKEKGSLIKDTSLIKEEIQLYLKTFNDYLIEQQLFSHLKLEKKEQISRSIVGNYGLFMPETNDIISNILNNFSGSLSTAVSSIDDVLLTTDDFSINSITKDQLIKSQVLIFQAMMRASTAVFIPEYISNKTIGEIRLPIALVSNVSLEEDTGRITLNLGFCKQAINDFSGLHNFSNARSLYMEINDLAESNNSDFRWEYIDYTIYLVANNITEEPCCSNSVESPTYKFIPTKVNNSQENNSFTDNLSHQLRFIDSGFKPACHHYERKCLVKFDCNCDNYWPCHTCHNGNTDPKRCNVKNQSYNIQQLKCLICNHEQIFTAETGNSCERCKTEFSVYYCGKCKHLLNNKDDPYHCKKCGICRKSKKISYHCDTCGVCYHKTAENNHICRAGAAHDLCPICLEDTFAGASKMLLCGHRVHNNCLQEMAKHNTKSCPMCRKTFEYPTRGPRMHHCPPPPPPSREQIRINNANSRNNTNFPLPPPPPFRRANNSDR